MHLGVQVSLAVWLTWVATDGCWATRQDVGVLRRAFTTTQLRELAALCEALQQPHGDVSPTHQQPLQIDWLA
jgi:hypothetical protein